MKRTILFGLVLTILLLIVSPVMAEEANTNSWGAGIGIPYGLMGMNFDFNIASNLDLSFGMGITPAGLGGGVGGKLYLAPAEASFRPRISCYYGTNTIMEVNDWYGLSDYNSFNGVTAGIGASIAFGEAHRHGIDFDLMYIISSELNVDEWEAKGYDVSGDTDGIKISIGYRRFF